MIKRFNQHLISFSAAAVLALLLSSCGYHLVGHGDGASAIPEDVMTLSIQGTDATAQSLLPNLKRQFAGDDRFKIVASDDVPDEQSHAVLRIEKASESYAPSTYDQTGVATQYRMTVRGELRLYRAGNLIWESGAISQSGEVFVTGGPTGIESSRVRIQKDIRKAWIITAWSRINSGF